MNNRVIYGVFDQYEQAGVALEEVKARGIGAGDISLYGRDFGEMRPVMAELIDGHTSDRFIMRSVIACAIVGFIVGLLTYFIPSLYASGVAGLIAAAFSTAVAGGVLGLIAGVIIHFDVPMLDSRVEEAELERGEVIVAVQTDDETALDNVEEIFDRCGALEVDLKAA